MFVFGAIVGIQMPFWMGCIIAVLIIILYLALLCGEHVIQQEIGASIYIFAGAMFIVGMCAGDMYVYVQYPDLRPDIVIPNPFVPPGVKP